MNTPVDVLIIGAGASGAAVAWSLADTRMRIVCLEQGDWQKPAEYPSTGRDWETRALGDFSFSPNRRANAADYPVNDDGSPIKIANFNGVGGGTILYAGHFPRFHPSDFRVRSLDGVGEDWPLDYRTLEPYYAATSLGDKDETFGGIGYTRDGGKVSAIGANALFNFGAPGFKLFPFVGLGTHSLEREGAEDQSDMGYNVGLGLGLAPIPKLSVNLRGEFNMITTGDTSRKFANITLGVAYTLFSVP